MDRTRNAVERMLAALDAPAYSPAFQTSQPQAFFPGFRSSRLTMRAGRTSTSGQWESTATPSSTI
jgi:hypothetical protein